MYLASIVLLLFVLPAGCVIGQMLWFGGAADVMLLVGKWFVFWAVGVRLFIAGVRQVTQPQFTAESIFEIKDRAALGIVRELGFANLSTGTLGLASLAVPAWVAPAAIVGGLFYGLAAAGHALRGKRNFKEQTALISDIFAFVILAVFVVSRGFEAGVPVRPARRPAVAQRRPGPGADAQARPRSKLTAPARSGGEGGRGPPTGRRGCR